MNLIIARVSVVLLHPVLAAVHVPLAVHHRVQPIELRVPRILQILYISVMQTDARIRKKGTVAD